MTIVVPLPWQRPPLSPNGSRRQPHAHAAIVRQALTDARYAVRAAQLAPMSGANIELHWRIPNKGRRDADNLYPVLKVCQDALVLEGVLPDDSWVHIPSARCVIHPPNGCDAHLWLTLEDPDKDTP